jgi:hypothetical protein
MTNYELKKADNPKVIDVLSAWQPLAFVIKDILDRFKIKTDLALEFGVERAYSTSVFSNYFKKVIGVDPFNWTLDDGYSRDYFSVQDLVKDYPNIDLIKGFSEQFINEHYKERFDLIHIDIGYDTHCYATTFPSAEWAVQHSDCVLFHDTISFPEINQVCEELAEKFGFEYYNYSEEIGPAGQVCGLGILIKKA